MTPTPSFAALLCGCAFIAMTGTPYTPAAAQNLPAITLPQDHENTAPLAPQSLPPALQPAESIPPADGAPTAKPDQIRATAELAPPEIPFHRVATYRIVVEAPEGVAISFPTLVPAAYDGMDLRERAPQTESIGNGRVRHVREWHIDPIQPRRYTLPQLDIPYAGGTATVPALGLVIRELSPDEEAAAAKPVDIFGVEQLPPPAPPWTAYALAAAAIAATLAAAAAFYYHRKRPPAPLPAPPPWVVARRRLKELQRRRLPELGRFEPYYVDLSAILRYYIEDRFALHAPEQTTQEFLETAAKTGVLSEEQRNVLARFLRHCDRVKFARYEPAMQEMADSFDFVRHFVEETTPREAPPQDIPAKEAAA